MRAFRQKDLNEILSIERRSFYNPWSRKMFKALSHISSEGFFVVEQNKRLIGYAIILFEGTLTHFSKEKKGHLINIAVHPEFRNKGVGKAMLTSLISNLKSLEAQEIFLEVRPSNTRAMDFYRKFGFKIIGKINDFYGGEDAVVMALDLS